MALRLVHRREPILTDDQLAFFTKPRTWPEILEHMPPMARGRLLSGIIQVDEEGFGFLRWLPGVYTERETIRGHWVLTRRGREYLRRKARLAKCVM